MHGKQKVIIRNVKEIYLYINYIERYIESVPGIYRCAKLIKTPHFFSTGRQGDNTSSTRYGRRIHEFPSGCLRKGF